MVSHRFLPGDLVEVWYEKDGQRITYRARVIGPARREGDYEVEAVSVGPDSKAEVGKRYAPMLHPSHPTVGMDLVSEGGRERR